MIFFAPKIKLMAVLLATAVLGVGCQKKENEAPQDITSEALNFYVLNQEIEGIRVKVSSTSADQVIKFLPGYYELANRSHKMKKDNALSKSLNKHPIFMITMDSCLSAATDFLALEIKAVEIYNHLADIDQQLQTLKQTIRNNSLLAKKHKTKINSLSAQQSNHTKQMDALKPKLNQSSQIYRRLLIKYNKVIMDEKILSYVNDDGLFDPFKWEKPAPAKKPSNKRVKK